MTRRLLPILTLLLALAAIPSAQTAERLDHATIAQIRDEGLSRSQVMDHIGWLADVYGPRLTGGPGIQQASEWTLKKFGEWGLANPHRETFQFGRGWSLVRFHATMLEPQVQPLIGFPGAWTAGTNGTVAADVVRVQIESEEDFATYKGKLAGKIALLQPAREVRMLEGLIVSRMDEAEMAEAATTPIPAARGGRGRGAAPAAAGGRGGGGGAPNLAARIQQFLKAEGVVATFNRGSDSLTASAGSDLTIQQQRTDGGTIFPTGGGSRTTDPATVLPTVTLAVEHYNRMIRVLDKGVPVKVELNLETKFYEETTPNGFNIVAEIPGTDPVLKDEVVLLGAHFDSVAASTWRDRQRHWIRRDDGGDADPQSDWRQATADDQDRVVGRRGAGPDRFTRLRTRALRRSRDDAVEAGAREDLGVLQLRQRHRQDPRRVAAGEPRRPADLPELDRAIEGSRRGSARASLGRFDRSRRRSTRSGFRRSSSWSIAWNTTRARTTPTWTPSTASSATTWSSMRPSSRCLPTTPRCATRSSRVRRCRARAGEGPRRAIRTNDTV